MDEVYGFMIYKTYDGPLNQLNMSKEEKQGYTSFLSQKARCYNKNDPAFKNYGKKGITVEYGPREFIGWWLFNLKTKDWKIPTVGRIDHSKSYCFDNIEMQEKSDNSIERISRLGSPAVSKKTICTVDGILIGIFNRTKDAANYFSISEPHVGRICNKIRSKTESGLDFNFYKEQTCQDQE